MHIRIEDLVQEASNYLHQETIAFSDMAYQCSNVANKFETESINHSWLSGAAPRSKTAKPLFNNSNSNTKYAFSSKLINQESLSLIKRILFSRNHLDIFGLSINTNFVDGVSDRDIKRDYNKMMNYLLENEKIENYNVASIEDLDLIPFNGTGMIKTAFKKLNEAYFTLKDPLKRDFYIINLSKHKKH